MSPGAILRRVELPNALFVMFAGVRTAMAVNVGTAPIAFLIGGGGLGELIFTGIDLQEFGMMLAGAIPTALLAVAGGLRVRAGAILVGAARSQSAAEFLTSDGGSDEQGDTHSVGSGDDGGHRLGGRCRSPDDRGRRQGVHRAADHDRDDGAAAEGEGLHARAQGGHGQRRGPLGAGERPDRRLLGIHGHRARGVQQDQRQVRDLRRRVQEDQGSRRRERHRLAQHVARQQYLRVRDEQGPGAEARHRHDERPREGGQGRGQAHVRIECGVLRAAGWLAGLADRVRLRVRSRQREADGYGPHLLGPQGPAGR